MGDFENLLLGTAVGDAFGAGIEFQSREWILENVDFTRFIDMRNHPHFSPGFYTDDTEHTIAVIKLLTSGEEFTPDNLLKFFRMEWEGDKERKGFERQGHGSIKRWYRGEKSIETIRQDQMKRSSPGNAPLMRASPIGLLHDLSIKEILVYGRHNGFCTHGDGIASEFSHYFINFVNSFLRNNENLFDYCDNPTWPELRKILTLPPPDLLTHEDWEFLCGPQPMEYGPKGKDLPKKCFGLPCDIVHTFFSSIYVCLHAKDAWDACKISCCFGGDVDSLAAITTGIMAVKTGLDSVPSFIWESLERLDYLREIGRKADEILSPSFG